MAEYIEREATVELYCQKCKGYYDGHCIHRVECDVDVIQTAPAADVQPAPKHTENMSTVAFCDRFICKNCDIHLDNWVKVVIDPDDGDELHYEYEFKFCPECGARIVEVEV